MKCLRTLTPLFTRVVHMSRNCYTDKGRSTAHATVDMTAFSDCDTLFSRLRGSVACVGHGLAPCKFCDMPHGHTRGMRTACALSWGAHPVRHTRASPDVRVHIPRLFQGGRAGENKLLKAVMLSDACGVCSQLPVRPHKVDCLQNPRTCARACTQS